METKLQFKAIRKLFVYFDYIENEIHLFSNRPSDWPTGCGDYNLAYIGEL
jgi:hypothetical protein